MADEILAEALARVEHKLDLLLKHNKVQGLQVHFPGQSCPLCGFLIDYQIDLMKNVVVRRCKCTTGKVAPMVPLSLSPVQPGATNGNAPQNNGSDYSPDVSSSGPNPKKGPRR